MTNSNSDKDNKRPWYQKWSTWAIVAAAVVLVICGIVAIVYFGKLESSRIATDLEKILDEEDTLKELYKKLKYHETAIQDIIGPNMSLETARQYLDDMEGGTVCDYDAILPLSKKLRDWCSGRAGLEQNSQ